MRISKFRFLVFFIIIFMWVARWFTYDFPCDLSEEISTANQPPFFGMVADFPDIRPERVQYTVQLTGSKTKVLLITDLFPAYRYGDLVRWKGEWKMTENSPDLCAVFWRPNIRLYAKNQGTFFLSRIFRIREFASAKLEQIFPEPHASFGKGLLLGDRGGLGNEIMDDFRRSGLIHLVALSGYNIALVIIFFSFLFQSLVPGWHFSLTNIGIIIFVLLTGASASVTRAALMGMLWLTGRKIGRPHAGFHALLLAAFIMILWNPRVLVYDIGFQLSVAATFGLLLFSRFFNRKISKWPSFFGLRDAFFCTLAAQLITLPILLKNFGSVSPWGLLSNILVTPIMPLIMMLLFAALVVGVFWLPIGIFFGLPAAWLMSWVLFVARWLGGL